MTVTAAHQSIRLGNMWEENGARFDRALKLLKQFPTAVDEIALFTTDTHAPIPLDTLRERVAALAPCLEKARAAGYRCGINHLTFLGHHQENRTGSLTQAAFSVDLEGVMHPGSLCMNAPQTLEYVRESVNILLAAHPDFLWIDDDVRFYHDGRRCFCDTCLETFRREAGMPVTREMLRAAFEQEDPASICLRDRWREHNDQVLRRFLQTIREAADSIDPEAVIGYMTCECLDEGYAYSAWADILSHNGRTPVKWRPGGGVYTDDRLAAFIEKAHALGRQAASLPAYVTDIQSEIENFPYQYLNKGAAANLLESALYIAAGCTGSAFNITPFYDEPLETIVPTLRRIADARPFLDKLADTVGREAPVGIGTGWTPDTYYHRTPFPYGWPDNLNHTRELHAIGFPPAYNEEGTVLHALSAQSVAGLTDDALKRILAGGVYCDAGAVEALDKRGFGEYVGFRVAGEIPEDALECYTDHPLNAGMVGHRRNCRQSFNHLPAAYFTPAPGAEILARLVDYAGAEWAGCCMGLYQNKLGGRVCVGGYYPWSMLQEYDKTRQLKRVFSWLTQGNLPVCVASFHRANLWARRQADGRLAVCLVNTGLDTAQGLQLAVRTQANRCRFLSISGSREEPDGRLLETSGAKDGAALFTLPDLGPWDVCLLVTE